METKKSIIALVCYFIIVFSFVKEANGTIQVPATVKESKEEDRRKTNSSDLKSSSQEVKESQPPGEAKESKKLYDTDNHIKYSNLSLSIAKTSTPGKNTSSAVHIPPEPKYNNRKSVSTALSIPNVLSDSVAKIEKNNNSQIGISWKDFLRKEPTSQNLQLFLKTLNTSQLLELMDYTSESDPSFASGFMEVVIIPELKARWSQEKSPWQNQIPYGQLLQIASDKQNPKLLRKVMIDMLGKCKRITNKNRNAISKQISQGLVKIIEDTENHGDIRAYAITDLGLISQQLHGDASPYSELFLQLAQDSSEDISVRVKSLQMLPILDNMQAISVLEESCMNYQPEDNAAIAKATMVALSDYAQKSDVDVLEAILRVLVVTPDSEAFSAGVYATSRLDESSFMTALPVLIAEKGRFQDDTLVEDSIHAALWRQPDAVMNAINSEDEEMVQAGIEAACYVPLPPISERLQELLATSSTKLQGKIRKALEKAEDIEGYELILNQIAKEGR